MAEEAVLAKIEPALDAGKPALHGELTPEERAPARRRISCSPTSRRIFACNVKEGDLADGRHESATC